MASFEMRNPGVWRVTISNGYGPDGKKKFIKRLIKVDPSKTILSQRREVEKEAAKIEADFQRRKLTEGKKIRLSEVAEEYLENHPMSESTKR